MNEFIEKLIGRLEEQQTEAENEMHRLRSGDYTLPCSYDITDIKEIVSESFKESIEIVNELAEEYNNAEEQGLLLRLPCKVGDTVYVIGSLSEFGVTEEIELKVFECMVNKITLNGKYGNTMQMDCKEHSSFGWSMNMRKIDELVFLTKAEAEQALKQIGE